MKASHWRLEDVLGLLRFLRPLRCRSCGERFYVPLFTPVAHPTETKEKDFSVRVRLKRPGRVLRVLLWVLSGASSKDA